MCRCSRSYRSRQAAPGLGACLDDQRLDARPAQQGAGGEAGCAGTDDHEVARLHAGGSYHLSRIRLA